MARVVRMVLSSMGVTPPLAALGCGQRCDGGVPTPLSQPGQVFVKWKWHDHRRTVAVVGITSLLDGFWMGRHTLRMVGHLFSEP